MESRNLSLTDWSHCRSAVEAARMPAEGGDVAADDDVDALLCDYSSAERLANRSDL